jgi:hypothetical protein
MTEIDQPHEILAERLGISLDSAKAVLDWHDESMRAAEDQVAAEVLNKIAAFLSVPHKNIAVVMHGLSLAIGLNHQNGTHSQAEVARQLNCTRSNVNHYVSAWVDVLGLDVLKFRKSPGARNSNRDAALRYWSNYKKS